MTFDAKTLLREFDGAQLGALVETMYLAADADGEFSDVERQQLASSIQQLAAGTDHESSLSGDALNSTLTTAGASLEKEGRESRLSAVRGALADDSSRRAAVGLAIQVLNADGLIRTSEREFVLDLAEALSVDRGTAADLVRDITRSSD
jgi:tellurite resistance protein